MREVVVNLYLNRDINEAMSQLCLGLGRPCDNGSLSRIGVSMSSAIASGIELCPLAAVPDQGFHSVVAVLDGDAETLVLYRDGEQVRAWLNVCPHAGRALDWAPGQFLKSREGHLVCAVHGASFELEGGTCVAGPCKGDALRAVPLRVQDGMVFLG